MHTIKSIRPAFVILGLALIQSLFGQETSITDASSKHYVFAHYMVCFPPRGSHATVQDFEAEIREAQQRGIDGFVLNCGGWAGKEPYYKQRVLKIYEAAKELGTGFKLMISVDFSAGITFDDIRDMVETFRDHPNQFYYEGKPVLSSYTGNKKQLTEFITREFQGKRQIFFVPYYFPSKGGENPTDEQIQGLFQENKQVAGFFFFGAPTDPDRTCELSQKISSVWRGAGKVFMAPVTPFYRGKRGNFRVGEYNGFEEMAKEWETAIQFADWVEIVTWNDWTESSYVASFNSSPEQTTFQNDAYSPTAMGGALYSHTGYLDASSYYIHWFKSGAKPEIKEDKVCYFYRLHPKDIPGNPLIQKIQKDGVAVPEPEGATKLNDKVFVTVFLKAPAHLDVQLAGNSAGFDLDAGVHNVSIPMSCGKPRFILKREGKVLIDKTGELEITDQPPAMFNYFSGSATSSESLTVPVTESH